MRKKIEILKKTEYKGCPIYIRRIGIMFEYLVIYKNELYHHHLWIKPNLTGRIFKSYYNSGQFYDCVKMMMSYAVDTIDKLIEKDTGEKGKKKSNGKEKRKSRQ